MIPRLDVMLWAMAALVSLATGLWQSRRAGAAARDPAARSWLPVLLIVALLALGAGILWHPWRGATGEDSLALLAGGALCCGLWQEWRKSRLPAPLAASADRITGTALIATALLIALAALAALREPWQAGPEETRSWLFGVRGILAGLGLGGWLYIGAGALVALVVAATTWRETRRGPGAPRADRVASWSGDSASVCEAGLRFSYPWVAGALVAGAAWSLTVFAIPWRGHSGEIWLAVNALIGVAYLQIGTQHGSSGIRFATYALAALGLVTAMIAAWQVPTLYS